MITAGHCSNVGNPFGNGNLTETLGNMTFKNTSHDDALIETSAGNNRVA
jgi:hypothetical protein